MGVQGGGGGGQGAVVAYTEGAGGLREREGGFSPVVGGPVSDYLVSIYGSLLKLCLIIPFLV